VGGYRMLIRADRGDVWQATIAHQPGDLSTLRSNSTVQKVPKLLKRSEDANPDSLIRGIYVAATLPANPC